MTSSSDPQKGQAPCLDEAGDELWVLLDQALQQLACDVQVVVLAAAPRQAQQVRGR